ncbi:type IV secretion system protein [Acidithiobacillus sp. VAN18-1]|uniref:Type IV secretion system protein n=1 Tax=Igneacidithiobacillus copahuensis TaxID=2724909 RepID=A0AAE2YQL8_9PROT|nr:type IV secretion system protein [Igneacidithiobacillus copahuensis]MBU2788233.1 type IV secretion system protein [Igneacidithiobacillus copahuensis]MBU2797109.1 type IV secretion system protein [Acidithiobacillus sp. VAN18-2]
MAKIVASTEESPDVPEEGVAAQYLVARREWLERYGDYIAQAKNWRVAALASIAIAALFGAGMVYEADRVHVVPYVVEVNHLGQAVHLAQEVQAGTYDLPVVRHVIANWVRNVRERLPVVAAEKQIYESTYDLVGNKENERLTAYFERHNPYSNFTRNEGGRTVDISSVLPVGTVTPKGGTVQVQWTETQYGASGSIKWRRNYEGTVTYRIQAPSSNPATLKADPFGIFITSFTWNALP